MVSSTVAAGAPARGLGVWHASSAYVLHSTLAYVRIGAVVGLAVLAIGAVLAALLGRRR